MKACRVYMLSGVARSHVEQIRRPRDWYTIEGMRLLRHQKASNVRIMSVQLNVAVWGRAHLVSWRAQGRHVKHQVQFHLTSKRKKTGNCVVIFIQMLEQLRVRTFNVIFAHYTLLLLHILH